MHIYKLLEALKPSQYRNLVKGWDKNKLAKEFQSQPHKKDKNAYRLYIPIPSSDNTLVEPNPQVKQFLDQQGFEIVDYTKGQVKKKSDGRVFRLGRVLPNNLKQIFANDPSRQATKKETMAVISRHPYDIGGMSTNRGWTSCQNLQGGEECEYVPADIKAGTLIAYEVANTDLNIKKPLGRILIKPYVNTKKETAYGIADAPYGTVSNNFLNVVTQWVNNFNKSKDVKGFFILHNKVYPEATPYNILGNSSIMGAIAKINTNSSTEEITKVLTDILTDKTFFDKYKNEIEELVDANHDDSSLMVTYDEDENVSARDTLMPPLINKILKIILRHPKSKEILSSILKNREINIKIFNEIVYGNIEFTTTIDSIIEQRITDLIKNAVLKRDPESMKTLLMGLRYYVLELELEAKEQSFMEKIEKSLGFIIKGTQNYATDERFTVILLLQEIISIPEVNRLYKSLYDKLKTENPRKLKKIISTYI